jgi:hypothetical protein
MIKSRALWMAVLLAAAAALRFYLSGFLGEGQEMWLRFSSVIIIILVGTYVLKEIAEYIEDTTEILSDRTKLASGLLQSLGTAFPDMVLGIVAAVISLSLVKENYGLAINFAIIAAATTFGSNIYNIAYAIFCVWRQNTANKRDKTIPMVPGIKAMGSVTPMRHHIMKPSMVEVEGSIDILTSLTVLTAIVVLSMVIFGQVKNPVSTISGDLYQLVWPMGLVILALCLGIMYYFRKNKREHSVMEDDRSESNYFHKKSTLVVLTYLLVSGVAILFAAESMVRAVEVFCSITGTPFVVAGVLAGIIGCIGEMIVIHNFTTNPKGRIGDALVGVGMDNIVTTMGAAIVAVMGGIFLGGNSLILIFILILTFNTLLIRQISKLKSYFIDNKIA